MTKVDLIDAVADIGLTKKLAAEAVDAVIDAIKNALANGDKVQLIGFGSFSIKERPARSGRNPQTGKPITIEAKNIPVFKAGQALKNAVA